MKFRNVKVRKPGGGYRTQRAMVLASGKLKFVKNTGRASAPKKGTTVAKRRKSTALARRRGGGVRRYHRRKHYRRRGGGGGIKPLHLALAGAGVAWATSAAGPAFVRANVAKIPGAKSFGNAAALGVACLAVDKFIKPNKWLKYAGYAGIVMAAMKVGEQGANFKWVGDDDVGYDLEDVEDLEDLEDLEDVEGDDE